MTADAVDGGEHAALLEHADAVAREAELEPALRERPGQPLVALAVLEDEAVESDEVGKLLDRLPRPVAREVGVYVGVARQEVDADVAHHNVALVVPLELVVANAGRVVHVQQLFQRVLVGCRQAVGVQNPD